MAAYQEYKRTGKVPPGLDAPSKPSKRKPNDPSKFPSKLPPGPKRTAKDLAHAELAAKADTLAAPKTFPAFASRRMPASWTLPIAREQARNDMPDAKLIRHYKESGIFLRHGLSVTDVKKLRDNWLVGRPIPLWAVPPDTPIALYRGPDEEAPDLIGRMLGVVNRAPRDELGRPGLSFKIPFVRFVDQRGRVYEYPALLGGSTRHPHATHASFAAVGPIARGQSGIPQLGFGFPNFAEPQDFPELKVGPSSAPSDIGLLADNIMRNTNWELAKIGRSGERPDSPNNREMDRLENLIEDKNIPLSQAATIVALDRIAKTGTTQEKVRAGELMRLARRRKNK